MNKEEMDKYLLLFLDYSFDKKATEDIFYNFFKMLKLYYEGKYYSNLDIANKKLERVSKLKPEELAIMFHNTYEKLAPDFGYETRKDTKTFNKNSTNGKLMIEVCKNILSIIGGE